MPEQEGRPPRLPDYTLPETSMDYLERMRLLCEKNGTELILVKAPTNPWRYWWYDQWEEQVAEYADKTGVSYYNMIPLCEEIGIDWSRDTYDEGVHLNVYGAEKVSRYFGEILQERHGIADRRDEAEAAARWNERVRAYYEEKRIKEEGS